MPNPLKKLFWLPVALILSLLLASACNENEQPQVPPGNIVSSIPWKEREESRYRLLKGDDIIGSGSLILELDGNNLRLQQVYERADGRFRNVFQAVVDRTTLRPISTEGLLSGPQGERRCRAEYSGDRVQVVNESKEDRRTDELTLPASFYDSASDLFLWRTISFQRGSIAAYNNIGTCNVFSRPDRAITTLEIIVPEEIEVPAGTFETWRLEMRTEGARQKVWIAVEEPRAIIRYDNGEQVFELESIGQ